MSVQTRTDNCGTNFGALAPCDCTNSLSVQSVRTNRKRASASVAVVQGTWQARPTTSPELPYTALFDLSVQNVRTLYRIRTSRSFRPETCGGGKGSGKSPATTEHAQSRFSNRSLQVTVLCRGSPQPQPLPVLTNVSSSGSRLHGEISALSRAARQFHYRVAHDLKNRA